MKTKRIMRLMRKIPNQVLMQDGMILVKADEIKVTNMDDETKNRMSMTISVTLGNIKKIQL